jgi:putative glutamine amidotransferase
MSIHIAIPEPTSTDREYNQRSLPPYLASLHSAGLTPVVVPLHERQDRVARILLGCQGILLPGSGYDVDPARYGEAKIPECGEVDAGRTAIDEQLLKDAFDHQKPILAICHGAQTLNVGRGGSLIQDLKTRVNHRPGREVVQAHRVRVNPASRLARLIPEQEGPEPYVNSSHHQAVRVEGENLIVAAVSVDDGVIEAVELDSKAHFVIGVQWHPERTYTQSAFSRAIFAAYASETSAWQPRVVEHSVASA